MHDVRIEVNSVGFGGFRSGTFGFSLESMCSTFDLQYVDVWTDRGEPTPIDEGNRCKLVIDGSTLIDGWVDESTRSYDVSTRKMSVTGRSTACDLVDCDVVGRTTQWSNQKISAIISALVSPFAAVQMVVLGDEGSAIPKFTIQRGETVGNAILRAARLRQMLVYTAGDTLVIAKAGATRTETILRRGNPIIEGERHGGLTERYSDYIFKGQTRARDDLNGVAASQIDGTITDDFVPRYRPKMIVAGGADGPADLGARAIMERNQRAGRSERLSLTVEGWKTAEGYFWEPNILVRVTDDWLDVDQDLLVVSVSLSFAETGGYRTQIELCDPRAFDLAEPPLIRRRRPIARYWAGTAVNAGGVTSFNAVDVTGSTLLLNPNGPISPRLLPPAPQPSRARTPRRRRR